jgi:hypothetical protein
MLSCGEEVRVIFGTAQASRFDPLIDKSSILPRAEVAGVVDPTRESAIAGGAAATFEPS